MLFSPLVGSEAIVVYGIRWHVTPHVATDKDRNEGASNHAEVATRAVGFQPSIPAEQAAETKRERARVPTLVFDFDIAIPTLMDPLSRPIYTGLKRGNWWFVGLFAVTVPLADCDVGLK
jgi:hypothetical protein